MTVCLLECREDEERQANYLCKEASQSVIEIMVSITDTTILMKI